MADLDSPRGSCSCIPPTPGLRMLSFPDGTQSGIFGLDEILSAVYEEGRVVNAETADEIVKRLAAKSYIAPSTRQRYCDVFVGEYERYVKSRENASRAQRVLTEVPPVPDARKGLFARFLRRNRRRRCESAK